MAIGSKIDHQIRVGGVGKDVDKIERVAVAPESDPPRICSNYSFSFLTLLTRNLIIENFGVTPDHLHAAPHSHNTYLRNCGLAAV
jgi:hypothetical protein